MTSLANFPRPGGHCACHVIDSRAVGIDVDDEGELTLLEREQLTALAKEKADLVYGDLVNITGEKERYRNDGIYIYDGNVLVDLNFSFDDYGSLPPSFHVFTNGVPLDYWTDTYGQYTGVSHNYIVWLDLQQLRAELLRNISHGPFKIDPNEEPSIRTSTTATYQGQLLRVIAAEPGDQTTAMRTILSSGDDVVFAAPPFLVQHAALLLGDGVCESEWSEN